jgi:hypothetical protein
LEKSIFSSLPHFYYNKELRNAEQIYCLVWKSSVFFFVFLKNQYLRRGVPNKSFCESMGGDAWELQSQQTTRKLSVWVSESCLQGVLGWHHSLASELIFHDSVTQHREHFSRLGVNQPQRISTFETCELQIDRHQEFKKIAK